MAQLAPMFQNPLSEAELVELGKLAVIWAQIDYLLIQAISSITMTSPADMEILLDRVAPPGKVARFKMLSERLESKAVKETAQEFCDRHGEVLGRRNHLTHGFWALYSPDGIKPYRAACYFPGNKKGLIFASELPKIVEKANALLDSLGCFLNLGLAPDVQNLRERKTYMGYGNPEGHYTADLGSTFLDLKALGHEKQ